MNERIKTVPVFSELEFRENPHIYLLNGEQIPSVSDIMKPLSRAKYSGVDVATLARAAHRGTTVHNSIENFIKFGIMDIPAEFNGYTNAFMDWWELFNPVVVGSEIRMYHKILRYGGTGDLLCYIGDDLTLVDYKTTYTVDEKLCGVQLEAYAQALASHGIIISKKQILQLKKDAKNKVYDFAAKDMKSWNVFGACRTVYDFTHQTA